MAKKCKYALHFTSSGPLAGTENCVACKSPNRPQKGHRGGGFNGYPIMGGQGLFPQWYRLCILGKSDGFTPSKCKYYA